MKKNANLKLLFQELGDNPYRKLNRVFLLISIIPVLVILYVVFNNLLLYDYLVPDIVRIFILTGVIAILGYAAGYKLLQDIISKVLSYAVKAKRADELKSTFAMSLAHDLKSPLATIKANVSGLKAGYMGDLKEEQKEAIGVCDDVADRMNHMIAELIATYMFEARTVKVDMSSFDLRDIIEEQYRELEAVARAKDISVSLHISQKPLIIKADREKMLRAVNNLLSNSIKYTPSKGRVTVRAYDADGFARLEFMNSGAPIPEDRLEKIFDKFERLDPSAEGQGLGLAIAKDIVELHKGKIWATSGRGKPNCFTVLLAVSGGKEVSKKKKSGKILVIEDEKSFADTLKVFLAGNGYEVVTALDAKSGMTQARKDDVALIILDLGLPDLDGLSVLKKLREFPETAGLPIIISTSDTTEGIEKSSRDAGADDFIQKPYDIAKLLDKIKNFLA